MGINLITHNLVLHNCLLAMSPNLNGKTVLITGASAGIGRSTALEFARTCPGTLRIIVTARRVRALHDLAAAIKDECGDRVKVLSRGLDVSDQKAVEGFVDGLPEDWRDIDVLLNNA